MKRTSSSLTVYYGNTKRPYGGAIFNSTTRITGFKTPRRTKYNVASIKTHKQVRGKCPLVINKITLW